jgi:hypothetical protein
VYQQWNLNWPHASSDVSLNLPFLKPGTSCPDIAEVNADAISVLANPFENLDYLILSFGMIVGAVYDRVFCCQHIYSPLIGLTCPGQQVGVSVLDKRGYWSCREDDDKMLVLLTSIGIFHGQKYF